MVRSSLVWVLAVGGGLVFLWYILAAGSATAANPPAPDIRPAELVGFGAAMGTLLATNLGAVLGITIKPLGGGGFTALAATSLQPWAQVAAAVFYIFCLLVAVYLYWQSGWTTTAAEILRTSLSTLFGVLLGAFTAALAAK